MNQIKYKLLIIICLIINNGGCSFHENSVCYQSEQITIERLSDNSLRHISYLDIEGYGPFACNGMIFINNGEALIVDTPTNNQNSKELIDWVESKLLCKIIGIVVTHFHVDCLGGLNEFHTRRISSYGLNKTIEFANLDSIEAPIIGFDDYLEINVGGEKVINEFVGEGHTIDNIVSYFPKDDILFGGCLVKELSARKGNLDDANILVWSNTIQDVKSKFPDTKIVIPGHGQPGNQELLDYTIKLFEKTE